VEVEVEVEEVEEEEEVKRLISSTSLATTLRSHA